MARDQIAVRTLKDKEREEHEERLMEQIRKENANPLQNAGEKVWDAVAGIYSGYLYSSGVLLILFSLWAAYPSFVRYRHLHLKRYRKDQLVFRRWFFGTVHMPKWDKKHLQRIVIPPPPQPQEQPDLYFAAAAARAQQEKLLHGVSSPAAFDHAEGAHGAVVRSGVEDERCGALPLRTVQQQQPPREEESPFAKPILSSKASAKAAFHNAFEAESAATIHEALMDINRSVYSQQGQFSRPVNPEVDLADVKSRVEWAVQKGDACVVLKENHTTKRSVPPGWEVWWASAEEKQRRNTCKRWVLILAFCRAMQDLLDMPEMPRVIQ